MSETVTVKWEDDRVPVYVLAGLVGLAPIALRALCKEKWDPSHISKNVVHSAEALETFRQKSNGQAQLIVREHDHELRFQFLFKKNADLVITDIPEEILASIITSISS